MGTLNSTMKRSILKVMERWPHLHTSGPKVGRSFADHLTKVAIVSHQVAKILQAENVLSDLDVLNAFYAALIHDTNKLLDGSLRRTALKDNIKELLTFLEVEDERLLTSENLQKLQFYVALHQDSGPAGMKLLLRDKKDEIIYRVVKFADKFDNFNSADLSLQISLKLSCEKLLQEISELSEGRFEYTKLFYHSLKEFRGMLSEAIHKSLSEMIQEKFECIAIARFVDGVVYLCPSNLPVDMDVRDSLIQELSKKLASELISVDNAVEFRNTGIQLKKGVEELPLEKVINKMLELASNTKYEDRYNTSTIFIFIDGLITYIKRIAGNVPKQEMVEALEDFQKILEAEKNPLEAINARGSLAQKYKSIADFVPLKNEDVEKVKESFIKRFHILHEKYVRNPQVKRVLQSFLRENFLLNGLGEQNLNEIVNAFENYGKYETTCSICGNSKDVMKIETAETPSLVIQQFTNRMSPHKRVEPLRRVCSVCRVQMLATKRSELRYSETSPIVLLLPTNYYPKDLVESMQEEVEEMMSSNSKEKVQKTTNSSLLGTIFPKKLPKINFGNTISFQNSIGGFGKTSWQKVATITACLVSYITTKLPVKVLVTTNLELLQDDIEFHPCQ